MAKPDMLLFVFAGLAILASFFAAEKASGHMPFSGYAEERFWGWVSGILLAIGFGLGLAGIWFNG